MAAYPSLPSERIENLNKLFYLEVTLKSKG
jgi:hypothetical protein